MTRVMVILGHIQAPFISMKGNLNSIVYSDIIENFHNFHILYSARKKEGGKVLVYQL